MTYNELLDIIGETESGIEETLHELDIKSPTSKDRRCVFLGNGLDLGSNVVHDTIGLRESLDDYTGVNIDGKDVIESFDYSVDLDTIVVKFV